MRGDCSLLNASVNQRYSPVKRFHWLINNGFHYAPTSLQAQVVYVSILIFDFGLLVTAVVRASAHM